MATTNKLVSLESVMEIVSNFAINTKFLMEISTEIESLPTYPEPTKWSNHALLQEYIDRYNLNTLLRFDAWDIVWVLQEIQSRLTEWTEYEIGKEYEFLVIWEENTWQRGIFTAYSWFYNSSTGGWETTSEYIRPIQVSPELTSAMAVLEANWYTVSKK